MNAPVAKKTYVVIWLALLILLLLTWLVAQVNLGPFNTVVALAIAIAKMFLVLLFFMHVRSSRRITWIFVIAGFIWLAIMIDLTLSDYLTRY
ncbi:MAG TPA: cytochrome C oxidase subunit IV family protein [Verrucomicrobiae bacterium]|jgi:cytochrome c oxidase subunit 4|nr:cytochrome C oxidase subunit IV family protein [Verrucomicrobiae bacterium]